MDIEKRQIEIFQSFMGKRRKQTLDVHYSKKLLERKHLKYQ